MAQLGAPLATQQDSVRRAAEPPVFACCLLLQDIEGVRTAEGAWYVVQSRPQVLHQ